MLPIADELPFAEDFEYMKDLRFGLALNGLFGGSADYSSSWVGRTFITDLELQILNLQPGLAWRVTDWLSVGASLNVYRTELRELVLEPAPEAPGVLPAPAEAEIDSVKLPGALPVTLDGKYDPGYGQFVA